MTMTDPEIILKKKLLNQTITDCKLQDKQYEKLKLLYQELDDHTMNGRTRESDRVFNEIVKLNREITRTESRCRVRLGLSKI